MPGTAPPVADERDGLLTFLAQQRYVLRTSAYGLTDEQVGQAPSASSLSIGGLLKHAAFTERVWLGRVVGRPSPAPADALRAYQENFRFGPGDTLEAVLADYVEVARETEEIVAGIADLDQAVPVPQPAPSWANGLQAWTVRWILLHLVAEVARHAGHADIVRESLDGATANPLLAAAENWPDSDFVTAWKPQS